MARYHARAGTLDWYSVDYWAVVKGSPNAKEGFKMVDWITDSKPLLALAEDWAVSPANKVAAADPKIAAKNRRLGSLRAASSASIRRPRGMRSSGWWG